MSLAGETLSRTYEQSRYAVPHNILRSEVIYGSGFQSPGGLRGFQQTLLHRMPVKAGQKLLEIGSGLGGAAFYLSNAKSTQVVGVDTSQIMISLANDRRNDLGLGRNVAFILGDAFSEALQREDYDVIYSKDSLMYEPEKARLFARCFELLRPGGWICVSDFCRGTTSPEFAQYVEVSGYHLPTIAEYAELLTDANFARVSGEDTSQLAQKFLEQDLESYRRKADQQAEGISPQDAEHITERWIRKVRFMTAGQLVQGLFVGQKPDGGW